MNQPAYIPRFIQDRLLEALNDTPVVLIHGPRQGGKTTLARHVGQQKDDAHFSFDDVTLLEQVFLIHRLPAWRSDRLGRLIEAPKLLVGDAGVAVKLSGTVVAKDFRGLKKLREATGGRFATGVVLDDGEQTVPCGEGLFAVPLGRLWNGNA